MSSNTEQLLNERERTYGNPVQTHVQIAQVWSGILGTEVTPVQVPIMMAGLKLVRASNNPYHKDNFDDVMGYTVIARDHIMELQDGD